MIPLRVPLLARPSTLELPPLDDLEGEALLSVARLWIGADRPIKGRPEALASLRAIFADDAALRARLGSLRPEVREVLAVVARYGGAIDEELLDDELVARGLCKRLRPRPMSDPLKLALEARLLVRLSEPHRSLLPEARDEIVLPRAFLAHVPPARPIAWQSSSRVGPTPTRSFSRSTRTFDLELAEVARAVAAMGDVSTQAGRLTTSSRKDLERLLPPIGPTGDEVLKPPAKIALAWHLLLALEVAQDRGTVGVVDPARLERILTLGRVHRDDAWASAWLRVEQWQDGIGSIADPSTRRDSTGMPLPSLIRARRLVTWALSRVAVDEPRWLEAEQFLIDFHRATGGAPQFVQGPFALRLSLSHAHEQRDIAPWLAGPGQLVANVVLVTLVHLGMVERGDLGGGRWCFRLTAEGRATFGAPEIGAPPKATTPPRKSLSIAPNLEIAVDVGEVDVAEVAALDRFARRTSVGARELVYRLDRESVYAGLESGLGRESIEAFLEARSRTEVPPPVSAALSEWAAGREAVRLRTNVTWVVDVLGPREALPVEAATFAAAYALGDGPPTPGVRVDDAGNVEVPRALDPITDARLSRFAERTWAGFQLTEASVRRATTLGISADQMVRWLEEACPDAPALARAAVRIWAQPSARAVLEDWVAVRIEDGALEATLADAEPLRMLGVRLIAPGWLMVERAHKDELVARLGELGLRCETESRRRTMTMGPTGGRPTRRRS
jgi:hypothetical protein